MAGQLNSPCLADRRRWLTHRQNQHRIRCMRNPTSICVVYVVLTLIAIPWYWRWIPNADVIIAGMPLWVISALFLSAIISCYTAWLLSFPWGGEDGGGVDP